MVIFPIPTFLAQLPVGPQLSDLYRGLVSSSWTVACILFVIGIIINNSYHKVYLWYKCLLHQFIIYYHTQFICSLNRPRFSQSLISAGWEISNITSESDCSFTGSTFILLTPNLMNEMDKALSKTILEINELV